MIISYTYIKKATNAIKSEATQKTYRQKLNEILMFEGTNDARKQC